MDSNIKPKISVVMPVYNGLPYLPKAIESILAQTLTDFELIIINDGSKDASLESMRSFTDPRVRVIDNPQNLGLIASLNIGLKAAQGKYIARMDQDDIAFPERFQREFDFLESHPDIVIVGTWSHLMDSSGKPFRIHRNALRNNVIKYELLFGNTITHPSIMMRREEVLSLGGYDPQWVHTEDYNLYSRAIKKSKLANIGEVLLYYRVHGTSLTGSPDSQAIIHGNTKKMIRENISYYMPISDEEHRLVTEVLIARNPNPRLKVREVFAALRLHKEIFEAFIAKERASFDLEDTKEVYSRYKARKNLLLKKFLVGKYHLLTRKHA